MIVYGKYYVVVYQTKDDIVGAMHISSNALLDMGYEDIEDYYLNKLPGTTTVAYILTSDKPISIHW